MTHVRTRVEGRLGHLTLDRPERINALDIPMVAQVSAALDEWAGDDGVDVVLIDGAGDRGLCAGGDLRAMWDGLRGGATRPPSDFLRLEYAMNARLAHYPKPVVAFMDGVVLGGGVGISAHCEVRVVTGRSQVGMPETAIGLCPDVGSLYLLARAPGLLGVHLALTGDRLDGASAIHAGLADHLVDAADLPALGAQLREGVVPSFEPSPAVDHPGWIDECYDRPTVTGIVATLERHPDPAARTAAATIGRMSPTSCVVTLDALRRAATLTVDQVLEQDLRVCSRLFDRPDFTEGVRALIIDKDRSPRWSPADPSGITGDQVQAYFRPLPDRPPVAKR